MIECPRCGFEVEPGQSYEVVTPFGRRQHNLERCFMLVRKERDELVGKVKDLEGRAMERLNHEPKVRRYK